MTLLELQHSRLRRARRLTRHADRVHAICIAHTRAIALGPDLADHYACASRAMALARKLYRRAEAALTGAA